MVDIICAKHVVEVLQALRTVGDNGGEMWEVTENAGHESSPGVLRFRAEEPEAKRHGVLVCVIREQSTQLASSVSCEVRGVNTSNFRKLCLREFGCRRSDLEGHKATCTYGAGGLSR